MYDLDVQFAPFLLDPSTPPDGKPRRQMTKPDDPPTAMEQRAVALGIRFARGRSWTSNSHLALEAAEFALEHGDALRFHRAMFRAYFEDLAEIGDLETVVRVGVDAGLPEAALRAALVARSYREAVNAGLQEAQQIGVTAVPTFVAGGAYGIVGAQELPVFEELLHTKFGLSPR